MFDINSVVNQQLFAVIWEHFIPLYATQLLFPWYSHTISVKILLEEGKYGGKYEAKYGGKYDGKYEDVIYTKCYVMDVKIYVLDVRKVNKATFSQQIW